ncbi:phosphoenolpyruvate carboxylase [Carboxylicivirga mesophila]|uniref:Phosphoenolpyruvate carboxylase n=1 Tax=Carboxylicivirga mesophila TaxID=1166478 RepID=A0ABS5K8L0_9BACT|nr:phosphoenolpyruvate carboxylase [Carboxylicivirga mesophila]MBS2211334.1 phosphoenolpyruvate carboxylase [Carboxylicivirga mesophila]
MNQIEKSYRELVELKYQLYNSLFLTLPLHAVQQTGLLLPLLNEACVKGLENGESPTTIVNNFFKEHKPELTERERISFLFKIIQYVERQIVLIDALEEAAYTKIHRMNDSDSWGRIKQKVENRKLEQQMDELLDSFGIRVVLTAHPTQFYPGRVLAISTDLTEAITNDEVGYARDLLQQLGKTPFYRKQKPSAYDEAIALTWYLGNIFYPAVGQLLDRIDEFFPGKIDHNKELITMGFWPGGDRDGNPFVKVDTTLKVARKLRFTLSTCYHTELKAIKRRMSFPGVYDIIHELDELFVEELTNASGERNVDLNHLLNQLDKVEKLLEEEHQGLFVDKIKSFRRKIKQFGFFFASIDVRQDSRVIGKAFNEVMRVNPGLFPEDLWERTEAEQLDLLLKAKGRIDTSVFEDELVRDTLESMKAIKSIQKENGERAAHRYIISNCRGVVDIAKVFALARLCSWGDEPLSIDIVPLFETVDDLKGAGQSMKTLYNHPKYKTHLANRKNRQTVMLGFSDGTKDGGYLMANWGIYRAKEDITLISRESDVEVVFFDGRGGPPARGGGNTHLFYSALGKTIDSHQIQLTIQGQTISSHYGIKEAAAHNLGHLLTAGFENNLFNRADSDLSAGQRELIEQMSVVGYEKYAALKAHPLFIPFLEERSTLKYYGLANIGSRPSKRGGSDKLEFDDLRAIPFVGAWSQLKQNVPGFYGLGTALKEQEDAGNLEACQELYNSSIFFRALISNSMQSMSKTNFALTKYMEQDKKFGEFWKIIYNEYLLTKEMVLKVSGDAELLQDNARSRNSIRLRESVVLPLLAIQQYALIEIQKLQDKPEDEHLALYERMVMRSLFGNINASRNSV